MAGRNEINEFAKKYDQNKAVVVKWEVAFMKEQGRKPTKEDFMSAPTSVRIAYRTYLEIKRVLPKLRGRHEQLPLVLSESAQKKRTVVSPGKIFRRYNSSGKERIEAIKSFHKLTSKLHDEAESGHSNVAPIPRGKMTLELDESEKESDFPIENILQEVSKTVESFDKDDFEESAEDMLNLKLDSGKTAQEKNSSLLSFNFSSCLPSSSFLYESEELQNRHSFYSNQKLLKGREVTGAWIDRCGGEGVENESDIDASVHGNKESFNLPVSSGNPTATPTFPDKQLESGKTKLVRASTSSNSIVDSSASRQKRKATEMNEFDFIDESSESGNARQKKKIRLSKKTKGTRKINDNYVRVDVNKKVFVRGRKKPPATAYKKSNWKLKKRQVALEAKIQLVKCRKCGNVGHFAKFCMKDTLQKEMGLNLAEQVDTSPFPSLQEAARMIWSTKASTACSTRTSIYSDTQKLDGNETSEETETIVTENSQETSSLSNSEDSEFQLVLVSHGDEESNQSQSLSESLNLSSNSNEPLSLKFQSSQLDSSLIEPFFSKDALSPQSSSLTAQDDAELHKALNLFGYKDFRPGQKEAIIRVLCGESTLVVLSTGSGKSLCYLLPAYLYSQKYPDSLTICVSPLVSLMEDQAQSLPPFLKGSCLHTNMSVKQREIVIEKIRKKKLQVLLVSPEAVCGGMFGLLRNTDVFPRVVFACVDEVHCVSEWSHNFRPSYLKLCKILRERLNVKTILGLTATATNHTILSVCDHLCIDPSSVIRGEIVPVNLRLSCSTDLNREAALLALLRSKRFRDCDSIIIYCTRREQCERIATLIRTNMTDNGSKLIKENSRRSISADCEPYHAGMSPARRKAVQNNFMSGRIRIVVATVAFGMGIDKPDIRAVIHYNMPKTFESYVQEIGRAGRDGLQAECHLFLDSSKGKDICELKRHVYSNSVDRATLRKLLKRIFRACTCHRTEKIKGFLNEDELKTVKAQPCPGHEVSFSVEKTVRELDLPDENIETLLCYLELCPGRKLVEILPKCYHLCAIQSYGGTNLFKAAARKFPALAAAIAMQKEKKKFKDEDVHLEFNFIEVAKILGWNSAQMRKELKSLEWSGTQFDDSGNAIRFRKSGLLVEFSDLAYRLMAPGTLSDEESDSILNFLHGRNLDQEKMELFQLNRVYESLYSNSCKGVYDACESFDEEKSDNLKKLILQYFNDSEGGVPEGWKPITPDADAEKEETIRQDIRKLLQSHPDCEFNSRGIARIFQGISSPCFPAEDWARNRMFWRRHLDVDFHFLCQIAAQEII